MTKAGMYKPDYDGPQPSGNLTPVEARAMENHEGPVRALVRRIHTAMLVLSIEGGVADLGVDVRGAPSHIVEFADKVDQTKEPDPPPRFRPTPGQISDMLAALKLLDGLRPDYWKVAFLRAIWEWHDSVEWDGGWSWNKVGDIVGMSDEWARQAHEAVIVQAARRSGLLPLTPQDHAIFVAAVKSGTWRCYIATATDPSDTMYDIRAKSPLDLEAAFAIWTNGRASAKRVVTLAKEELKARQVHASWYFVEPNELASMLIAKAQEMRASWQLEELEVGRRKSMRKAQDVAAA